MAINPNDFKVCSSCRHVNLVSDSRCRGCYSYSFYTVESASRPGTGSIQGMIMVGIGVVLLFFFPVGTIAGIFLILIGWKINKASIYNAKERRNSFDREAVQLLSTIASTQQREAENLYQIGLQAFASGSFETAITSLEPAIKLGASDKQGRYVLAASYYNRDEFDKCIPILKALVEEQAPPAGTAELLTRAYVQRGISTVDQLDFVINQGTGFSQSLQDEITLACAKYCEGNPSAYPNTVSILERANELEPSAPIHVLGLLRDAMRGEDWARGCTYGARLSIEQHDADSIALYAICLCKAMDNSDEAVEVYRAQLRNHPEDSEIRLRCAQTFMAHRQFGEAETLLRDGVIVDSNDLRLRYHLALVLMMSGRIQDCVGELQKILRTEGFELYRSKEEIYVLLARCFVRMGMLEAAMKQYLLAGRSEKHLEDLYDLGLKFEAAEDARNARACWEEVYATDIRFKDVAARICSSTIATSV